MTQASLLGVHPALAVPALIGVFVVTVGPALIGRRLLKLRSSLLRVVLCAFFGLAVAGASMGPLFTAPGWQWDLLPLFWGVNLAATMLALLLLETVLPSSGPGLFRHLYGRLLRARRYLQVSRASARNGLPRHLTDRPSRNTPERNAQFALALRRTLEECGVTFVKLGQVLSTRRDLLPDEFIDELSKLQNDVPPAPWEEVRLRLTEELGAPPEQLFTEFEQAPLAAASIAQVHRATLPDGRRVVVKVQRPGIVRRVERDLDICRRVAHTLEQRYAWAKNLGAVALADGFADALREELDFRVEARNLTTVKAAAAQRGGRATVKIPDVHADLTTARVLVMELLDGIPLGRSRSALDDRDADREALARTLLSALLRQVMVDGVFHADPHPGNILLLPDNTLALLDFGSVGRLDTQLQGSLQRLLLAIDQRDPAALRDAFIEVMDRSDGVDGESLERDLGRFMARHLGPGLAPDVEMFTDMFRIVSAHGVAVPAEVAAVFRALATLEGTLAQLAPGFNIVNESRAFAAEEVNEHLRPATLRQTVTDELMAMLPVLRRIPRRADRITADLERGRLTLNVRLFSHKDDERVAARLLHQAMTTVLAATSGIMAVLLLGSDGGPEVSNSLSLYAVFGYNLLVFSIILMLRVMFNGARAATGRDG
ncbi:AarF/UbiB family protein [Streptomyces sp. NPDC001941]|uniref:ABC1 kinase family protein n=1 Tax=Streptomyces sp. NPDC001941 TaxID=3154659 RepID=UPI003326C645